MLLTKIDAAERQLVTAIRLFFDDGDPVAVCTLASAARATVHALCEARGVRDFVETAIDAGAVESRHAFYRAANEHSNWFKHADRDPDAVLDGFDDRANDGVLWIACHDFGRLTGEMAIEMQVYEAWFLAQQACVMRQRAATRRLAVAQLHGCRRSSWLGVKDGESFASGGRISFRLAATLPVSGSPELSADLGGLFR